MKSSKRRRMQKAAEEQRRKLVDAYNMRLQKFGSGHPITKAAQQRVADFDKGAK